MRKILIRQLVHNVRDFPVAQIVKNLPAKWETWVRFLGWEDSPGEGIGYQLQYSWASLVAHKNLPAMQETWVRSLGWEDSLEEEMATHLCILAWKTPCTEEPGRLQSMGS